MKKLLKNLLLRNCWSDFEIILQELGFDISGCPDYPIQTVIAMGKLPSPYVSPPGSYRFPLKKMIHQKNMAFMEDAFSSYGIE